MSEKKHGAAEWLRGIIGRYEDEADGFSGGCSAMVKMFGIDCKEETCRSCMVKLMTAIADRIDAERALPDGMEWPRFEDGELVKVGDEVEYKGETMRVYLATFDAACWALWCSREGIDSRFSGPYGERVKRPTNKVLDADGAAIRLKDWVWYVGIDAEITKDNPQQVVGFVSDLGMNGIYAVTRDYPDKAISPKMLTHRAPEQPDSWEKLEEDARKTACNYALAPRDEDGLTTCDGCRFQKSESCSNEMTLDVVERAKKLAGIEE